VLSKEANQFDRPSAQLPSRWILGVLGQVQRNPNFACPHEISDTWIGDILRFGDGTDDVRAHYE
jgi:hypothetical protein